MKLIGPFKQIVTLAKLPLRGKLSDEQLEIIEDGGILLENGIIAKVQNFNDLKTEFPDADIEKVEGEQSCLPALTDCHTHVWFGGKRANDFAMRIAGKTYLEIAESGGGIWSSVQHTSNACDEELLK